MSDYELFVFSLELIDELINSYDDFSFVSTNAENVRRLEKSRECLRKAYVISAPIRDNIKNQRL